MKKFEIAEKIAKHVPILAERDKKHWQECKELRQAFVNDYPVGRISSLTLDQYVIGKGAGNRSFCYRLEEEMDCLGRIKGSPAPKFGVYFGKSGKDTTRIYRSAKRWGKDVEIAFVAVKRAIVELIRAAARSDYVSITGNPLSPMFKGKILFVFNPKLFAPIYSREHLTYFISELNIPGSFKREIDMQRALMEYRKMWPELAKESPVLYMRLLYEIFDDLPKKSESDLDFSQAPILEEAVNGAQFISEMPISTALPARGPKSPKKIDYEKFRKNSKRTGDRGEAIVLEMERNRLLLAKRDDLADSVVQVSETDDSAGFDILSFDENGTERPIEVKATTGKNLSFGFYITKNEVKTAKEEPNYHLYIVFEAMSKHPKILPLKKPSLDGGAFKLQPVIYLANFVKKPKKILHLS
jgi:hypothetical protein